MNKDYNLREQILFKEDFVGDETIGHEALRNAKSLDEFSELLYKYYNGGCRSFKGVSLDVIKELVKNDFLKLDERQNDSPSTQEMIKVADDILEKDPAAKILFEGYAVTPFRNDYRVTITTIILISSKNIDDPIYESFIDLIKNADEIDKRDNFIYAWWD